MRSSAVAQCGELDDAVGGRDRLAAGASTTRTVTRAARRCGSTCRLVVASRPAVGSSSSTSRRSATADAQQGAGDREPASLARRQVVVPSSRTVAVEGQVAGPASRSAWATSVSDASGRAQRDVRRRPSPTRTGHLRHPGDPSRARRRGRGRPGRDVPSRRHGHAPAVGTLEAQQDVDAGSTCRRRRDPSGRTNSPARRQRGRRRAPGRCAPRATRSRRRRRSWRR